MSTPAEQPYEAYRATTHFGSLDGLRCLSILLVVWHHAGGGILKGYLGVDLFFVISGYLITTLLLRERHRYGTVSFRKFYARRTLRIFPLYYGVLALYVAMTFLVPAHTEVDASARHEFFRNLPYYATYTSNWFVVMDQPRVIFYFAWSLAAEEQFYLAWPFLLRLLPRNGPVVVATVFLCVGSWLSTRTAAGPFILTLLGSVPPFICGGCLLAFALDRPASFRLAYRFLGARGSAAMALAATVVYLASPVPFYLGVPVMVWLVGACCIRQKTELSSLLENRALVEIGRVSYGMYLLHMIAINITRRILHIDLTVPLWIVSAAIAIGLATLSYRYFEAPFLRLKARFDRAAPSS